MMKKILLVILILVTLNYTKSPAQCNGLTSYDLTVSSVTVQHPSSPSFTSAVVCPGAILIDSTNCCTRYIHIMPGGTYEIGGTAYAFVLVKNGGTFNANNSTMVFGLSYEAGATILNYSGPSTLCPAITFVPSSCTTEMEENDKNNFGNVFYNTINQSLEVKDIKENSELFVYDVLGKKMFEQHFSQNTNNAQSLNSFTPGVYIYHLISIKGKILTGKFIKTN